MSIDSTVHKTYNNDGEVKLRELIVFCLDAFKNHVNLPYVNRVGLRYINECPLQEKSTKTYNETIVSGIQTNKFAIENIDEMHVRVIHNVGDGIKLIYQEFFDANSILKERLNLDIDGFLTNVLFEDCIDVTDKIHSAIEDEFFGTLKEPVLSYMKGNENG